MCKQPTINLILTPEAVEQRRLRIRLSVFAYAYEMLDTSLVPDHVYDEMSRKVNPAIETGHPVIDEFFKTCFEPTSGAWVRRHPEIGKLKARFAIHATPTVEAAPMQTVAHEVTPDGELTDKWAIRQPGFTTTVKVLLCCARCGEYLKCGHNTPRKAFNMLKPTMYFMCDECFDALPD